MASFYSKELISSGSNYRTYHLRGMVHGQVDGKSVGSSQGCNCGTYPAIWISMDVKCVRNPGSSNTTFECTNVQWEHNTSGTYGYYFQANIGITAEGATEQTRNILLKNNTTGSSWWNHVTKSGDFTLTLTTTKSTAYFNVRVGGVGNNGCYNGSLPCFGNYTNTESGSGNKWLYNITLELPPYDSMHTLTYTKHSSTSKDTTPKPTTQSISEINGTKIQSTTTFPMTIRYRGWEAGSYTLKQSEATSRNFSGWKIGNTIYQNGATVKINSNMNAVAQWGDIPIYPPVVTRNAFINYDSRGGVGLPYTVVPQQVSGYSLAEGGPIRYEPDPSKYLNQKLQNIDVSLNEIPLFAVYGVAVYNGTLPTTTRPGYAFDGWYLDQALTKKATTPISIPNTSITLYAKWSEYPVKQLTSTGWTSNTPYVWKKTDNGWKKIAPIYKMTSGTWKNISDNI